MFGTVHVVCRGLAVVLFAFFWLGVTLGRKRSDKPAVDTDSKTNGMPPSALDGIPSEPSIRLPLLESLRDGRAYTLQESCGMVSDVLGLTDGQCQLQVNGDGPGRDLKSNVSWARTWLKKKGLVEYEAIPGTQAKRARISALGREVLEQRPQRLDDSFMHESLASRKEKDGTYTPESTATDTTVEARNWTSHFKRIPADRPRRGDHLEQLIQVTPNGNKVRSKNELVIASRLEAFGIPYGYEVELSIDGTTYYPDFTIETRDGRKYYWEHLGMMDRPDYRERWDQKLRWYSDHGVCLYSESTVGSNGTLITTHDGKTEDGKIEGLSSSYLDSLIHIAILQHV